MKRWAVMVTLWPHGPMYEMSRHWTRRGALRRERRIICGSDSVASVRKIYPARDPVNRARTM